MPDSKEQERDNAVPVANSFASHDLDSSVVAREQVEHLRAEVERLKAGLVRYGSHSYRCRYTPVQYDHVGTPQAGGNPCTCGFNDVFTALRAETDAEGGEHE